MIENNKLESLKNLYEKRLQQIECYEDGFFNINTESDEFINRLDIILDIENYVDELKDIIDFYSKCNNTKVFNLFDIK